MAEGIVYLLGETDINNSNDVPEWRNEGIIYFLPKTGEIHVVEIIGQ